MLFVSIETRLHLSQRTLGVGTDSLRQGWAGSTSAHGSGCHSLTLPERFVREEGGREEGGREEGRKEGEGGRGSEGGREGGMCEREEGRKEGGDR